MRVLDDQINERITLANARFNKSPAWQIKPPIISIISSITSVVPRVFKGDPVTPIVPFNLIPSPMYNPGDNTVKLGSSAVNVRGSFAPTITDGGFTYVAGYDSVTIYYDGTNNSKRIRQRRRTGYNETLPAGFLTISGLTPSAEGAATGPSYDLIPFYIPGSCSIGWISGNAGKPGFAFATGTVTLDDLNKASIRGREAISDGVMTITLIPRPVPAPPPTVPPPPDPGTQTGNTAVNGTLTVVTDYPGQSAAENISFQGRAHASDSSGKAISGWTVYLDNTLIYQLTSSAGTPGPWPSISFTVNTNPGNHTLIVKGYNTAGTHADVTTHFSTSDLGGGVPPTGPPPTPPPPPPPDPRPPQGCVMVGTVIETLGPSPWHQQQLPQNEWVRIFTDRGRELIGTPDHPLFTARAGRTEMRDIRKGDKVLCIEGEETVMNAQAFARPGFKIQVHMDWGHLFWANGFLSHNVKPRLPL